MNEIRAADLLGKLEQLRAIVRPKRHDPGDATSSPKFRRDNTAALRRMSTCVRMMQRKYATAKATAVAIARAYGLTD